jgi:hypothetical protein
MFCANCGQQIAEGSETCPLCRRQANIPWQPPPASSPMAGATPAPIPYQTVPYVGYGPRGVGGWLLFFCICFTILWPLLNLSQYVLYRRFGLNLFTVVALVRLAFGVLVGVVLWMQKPVAMVLLRIYFALGAVSILWSLYALIQAAHYYNAPLSLLLGTWLVRLVPSLVFLVSGSQLF